MITNCNSNIISAAAGNEQRSDHLHDRGSIHIDGHTQRQNKRSDLTVNTKLLVCGIQIQRKSCCAGGSREAENKNLEDLFDEDIGVQLADQADVKRVANKQVCKQNGNSQHAVGQSGLQVVNAISSKGAAQQHKNGCRTELPDSKAQEGHNDLADFLAEPIDNTFLAQTELVHAETNNNGDEHHAQHRIVNAHGSANVAWNNVQNDQKGIGAGCSGACGYTFVFQTVLSAPKYSRAAINRRPTRIPETIAISI